MPCHARTKTSLSTPPTKDFTFENHEPTTSLPTHTDKLQIALRRVFVPNDSFFELIQLAARLREDLPHDPPPRPGELARPMCLSRTASEQLLERQMERQRLEKAYMQSVVAAAHAEPEQSRDDISMWKPKQTEDLADVLQVLSTEESEVRAEPRRSAQPCTDSSAQRATSGRESDLCALTLLVSNPTPCVDWQEDRNARLKWREFALVYVAYMGFLCSRKNYGFWLRPVISELGYAKGQAGLIGSTLEVTYGTCSFLNGVVIDSRSPKHLLMAGLVLSAVANVLVAGTDNLSVMVVVWGLNGAVQSVGWPSVTNVFLAWFPDPAARGAWYSLLSTCQNAGAALVPLLVSASVSHYGWRASLYAPAVASCMTAVLLGVMLYGSPSAANNERFTAKVKASPADLAQTMRQQVLAAPPRRPFSRPFSRPRARVTSPAADVSSCVSSDGVFQVFLNPALWLMAASYFGCSMVRTCLQDWTSLFLFEAKGLPLATSARCLFLWELGGFGGTFAAGAISDKVFGGRRGPVVCVCCALLAPSLAALLYATNPLSVQLIYFWMGICAFPVHVLLGLFSREAVPPAVSSSAGGFVKMIAQIGGASAGARPATRQPAAHAGVSTLPRAPSLGHQLASHAALCCVSMRRLPPRPSAAEAWVGGRVHLLGDRLAHRRRRRLAVVEHDGRHQDPGPQRHRAGLQGHAGAAVAQAFARKPPVEEAQVEASVRGGAMCPHGTLRMPWGLAMCAILEDAVAGPLHDLLRCSPRVGAVWTYLTVCASIV